MKQRKVIALISAIITAASVSFTGCVGSVQTVGPNDGSSSDSTSQESGAEDNPFLSSSSDESSSGGESSSAPDTNAEDDSTPAQKSDYNLTDNIQDGVILHAWSWSFNTIKETMADIAAAGYSTVQTSPINKVIEGGGGKLTLMGEGKWYYHYQPTDWKIGNYQLGTEEEFKAMCAEADKYGIKIIVDVLPNHTTSAREAVEKDFIDAVGGKDKLYHKNSTKEISNFSDRLECTTASLTGLGDVNTENPAFQEYFLKYLNQCIADGADGFRYDTAKHIGLKDDPQEDPSLPNNFWDILGKINDADRIFNYGEVLQGDNERIDAYLETIGYTTASNYGATLRSALSSGRINADVFNDFKVGDGKNNRNVVTWVESHDNYTDGTSVRYDDNDIILGWAVIAGQGDGTPLFFDRPFGSSAEDRWGNMNRIGAAGSDLYKDKRITAVNRFRNAMAGEDTVRTSPDGNKKFMSIARGSKGLVLINGNRDEEVDVNLDTKLSDGTYEDRTGINGSFTVSGGKITGKMKAHSPAVLYNDGYKDPVGMPVVSVEAPAFTTGEDSVKVTLHAYGCKSAKYSLNGSEKEFKDGDTIDVKPSDEQVLTVSATNSASRTSSMTYYFNHIDTVKSGSTIEFTKPDSWGNDINIYIYDESKSPVDVNDQWPGEPMTSSDNKVYTYTTDREWSNAMVIFNDGTNQYPGMLEPGAKLEANGKYKP